MINTANLKDRTLLVLCSKYPDVKNRTVQGIFVKDRIELIKNNFKKIIVISPKFEILKYPKSNKYFIDYSYDNVNVYFPRCKYIPIDWTFGKLLDNRLDIVLKTIQKHKIKFDIIHAHFTWPSGYIASELKRIFNTSYILTVHENRTWLLQELKRNYKLHRQSWKDADILLRVNSIDYKLLEKFNSNVFHIDNFIGKRLLNMTKNQARKKLMIESDKKIIFALGVHIKRKGFQDLIDAMKYVVKDTNNIVCYIGGSGSYTNKLHKKIKKLGLESNVKLIGRISNNDVSYWFNSADIFVFPSHSESFGITLIEALYCGIPVVSTINGASEFITNHDADVCIMVNKNSPLELSDAICKALDKKWDYKTIALMGNKYNSSEYLNKIINFYQKLI